MTQKNILSLLALCSFTSPFSCAFVPFHLKHFSAIVRYHGHYDAAVTHLYSQPQDSKHIQSSSASNSKPKTKYVLGENVTGGLLEEEAGLYWNTLFDHADETKVEKDNTNTNTNYSELKESKETVEDPSFNLTGAYALGLGKNTPIEYVVETKENDEKQLKVKNTEGKRLSRAFWFYGQGDGNKTETESESSRDSYLSGNNIPNRKQLESSSALPAQQELKYEDIDQSIPLSVYYPDRGIDLVWDLLRQEALSEAEREPILVSFLYSNILNHPSLESALAFHLATRLASPSMDSIQIMNIILDALDNSKDFARSMRADIMAVRDRDPACTCLPDVFLHFKGFHALQSYRVAHYLWNENKKTLAHYVQSQMSQNFQIDIHPQATLMSGIMLDHGTGVVIGETARVGYNCSILHHVTLGGSGKRGVERHPKVGDGVLLGAGSTILGNIVIGEGSQVGAGTLVIDDLPAHSVAVGVPAKIIGSYKAKEQPSQNMDQVGSEEADKHLSTFSMDGI